MKQDLQLAYLGLEVSDPELLNAFFAEVIGLSPGAPGPEGTTTWRNDDKAHRLIVEPGPANDATFLGFEVPDDSGFEVTVQRLLAAGFDVHEVQGERCSQRRVQRLAEASAPWGGHVEIVTATTAFDDAVRFVTDGLGMEQSDWLDTEIMEGIEIEIRFYHCNARHHTVALAKAPFELPQRLHHVMFETNDRDDVGAAFDRAWASSLGIPNGLGVHDNDRMFSFYVESPAGFQVEVGYGARTITDDWDDDRRYDQISLWGHQPLRAI